MKLLTVVTLFPLLFTAVFAATNRDIIRARQVQVKRDLLDVCVALNLDVRIAPGGLNILAGHLDICLCLSLLPDFLKSNSVAGTVTDYLGPDDAHDYFTKLIQSQDNKQQCHYPPHAIPVCNLRGPCDFTCDKGYTPYPEKNPTQCICKAPNTECNGVCGFYPHGCSSQGVTLRKRSQPVCSSDKTVCGVPGSDTGAECVDTTTTESCGGCTVPPPFGGKAPKGKNCRGIPHVKEVTCKNGVCVVLSCEDGFSVSPTKDSCTKNRLSRVRKARDPGLVGDDLSLLRRGVPYTNDDVLRVLLDKKAINGFYPDLLTLKKFLGVEVLAFKTDDLLEFLILQELIIFVKDVLALKDFLRVWVDIL